MSVEDKKEKVGKLSVDDTEIIDSFSGRHYFLSNFFPVPVAYEGLNYPSSEVAYQAAKSNDKETRVAFLNLSPRDAKRIGRSIIIRPDWSQVKLQVMEDIVRSKFYNCEALKNALLRTGEAELVEGNWWGDTFWGVCKGVGENHLGKILMKVRKELGECP